MSTDNLQELRDIRRDPRRWFRGFGRWLQEETMQPTRGPANVLQRRVFEHYRRCQEEGKPCRMVVLKYRRAGSSTAGSCLMYMHSMNYKSRLGVIGTDYKASTNMMEMIRNYGEHDDFPGWTTDGRVSKIRQGNFVEVTKEEWSNEEFPFTDFNDKVSKNIATKLIFKHGSSVELYTAQRPVSARSAGLNGFHATECAFWANGGALDGAETLKAMRNTLPKHGFHVALEESTANGAQGPFYETCRSARWPGYAEWAKQFMLRWPLEESRFGKDLQYVFIFSAWFEDSRHVPMQDGRPVEISKEDEAFLKSDLTKEERELIARFQQEGPRGPRLGGEVNATVWEQLAWRRGIIENVCTKGGVEEFKQEYPATPEEAFRCSGSPALDQEGVMALETLARRSDPPLLCKLDPLGKWKEVERNEADWMIWERPIDRCKYLIVGDAMSGTELVTGTGEKDNHAFLILRDAYTDKSGVYHKPMVAGRLKPPCQLENDIVAGQVARASLMYGGALIVIEATSGGVAMLVILNRDYNAPLFLREITDSADTSVTRRMGWVTGEASRRVAIDALKEAVREQEVDVRCTHITAELASLILDEKGKAVAGGSAHDDDAIALAIGIVNLPYATRYQEPREKVKTVADDDRSWKRVN